MVDQGGDGRVAAETGLGCDASPQTRPRHPRPDPHPQDLQPRGITAWQAASSLMAADDREIPDPYRFRVRTVGGYPL
jgi:hypothetical protein